MLKIQQPAVERQGLAARRAAGSPQHLVGLAEVATGHGERAAQPRGLSQRRGFAAAGGLGLDGSQDRLRPAQMTGADQRPHLRRAPPQRGRLVVIDLGPGQRQGRAMQDLVGVVPGQAQEATR